MRKSRGNGEGKGKIQYLRGMTQEGFKFYKPCGALRPYVRYYWAFRSDRPLNVLTFPIGCTQLVFHKGTPLYIPELNARQSRLTVSGQVSFPSHLRSEGSVEMVVAVFRPYGMSLFLRPPVSLLRDREVSGYDLEDEGLNELAARVFDLESADSCVEAIERWLTARMAGGLGLKTEYDMKRITAAVDQLLASPESATVTAMASAACLGKKQFERLFSETVGMNPKAYARIARFQKSLKLLQHREDTFSLAQLAYRCGYADQSHLIREFRRFSGHTPRSLLKVCEPYSDLFTHPV